MENESDKFKIVILTKFTYEECLKPMLTRYNTQRRDIYPSFFSSMKQFYMSYGMKKLPKIILWDFNTFYKFPKIDKKYNGRKRVNIIYGFNPILTQYPLNTETIANYDTVDYILNQKRYNDFMK